MPYAFNDNKSKFDLTEFVGTDKLYDLGYLHDSGLTDDKTKLYILPKQKLLLLNIDLKLLSSDSDNSKYLGHKLPQVIGCSAFAYNFVCAPLYTQKVSGGAGDFELDAYAILTTSTSSDHDTYIEIHYKTRSYDRRIRGQVIAAYSNYNSSYPLSSATLVSR